MTLPIFIQPHAISQEVRPRRVHDRRRGQRACRWRQPSMTFWLSRDVRRDKFRRSLSYYCSVFKSTLQLIGLPMISRENVRPVSPLTEDKNFHIVPITCSFLSASERCGDSLAVWDVESRFDNQNEKKTNRTLFIMPMTYERKLDSARWLLWDLKWWRIKKISERVLTCSSVLL